MKYEDVLQKIGGFGRYQKIALCLFGIPTFFDAMTSMMLAFLLGSHGHRCRLPDIVDNVYSDFIPSNYNSSNTTVYSAGHHNTSDSSHLSVYTTSQCYLTNNNTKTACNDWVYDTSVYRTTLISKFNMVCDDRFMRSHVMLSHFVGTLCNALVCGFLCDIFGRKPVLMVGILLLIIPNFIRPWISSLYIVMFCEFLNATGSNLSYVIPFTLVTEIVDPAHRVLANFAINFSYCLGSLVLLLYAYFIRDWETLIMVISGPIVICFFIFTFVTESPRWLLLKGRTKEALKIFQETAKFNNRSTNFNINEIKIQLDKRQSLLKGLQCMLKSKQLIKRFFILLFNWFACSMIYFGISMNTGDLGGDVYINYAISTIVETIAVVLCYFFADRFPRKAIYCPAMIVGGVACLCAIFTSLYGNESIHWITIALAMIGKLGVTTAFFIIYLITSEVFPMVIRASMFSVCSTGARIGSMASSYIGKFGVLINTSFGTALPLVIFGCVGTLAGFLSLLLPETRHANLPETFEEAVNMKSNKDKSTNYNTTAEKFPMIPSTKESST